MDLGGGLDFATTKLTAQGLGIASRFSNSTRSLRLKISM